MPSLFYCDRVAPWMEDHGITDDTLGFLQTAGALPASSRKQYLKDNVDDAGAVASIENALAYAEDKGIMSIKDLPELKL